MHSLDPLDLVKVEVVLLVQQEPLEPLVQQERLERLERLVQLDLDLRTLKLLVIIYSLILFQSVVVRVPLVISDKSSDLMEQRE